MFKQFANLIKIVLALSVLSFGALSLSPAYAGGGGEGRERKVTSTQKIAKELEVVGAPARTRAKIISSVGLAFGTAVGEAATTCVSLISRCLGHDPGYRFGDLSKQSWKGFKRMWGMDSKDNRGRSAPRPQKFEKPAETRQAAQQQPAEAQPESRQPGIGHHLGSQAIDPGR